MANSTVVQWLNENGLRAYPLTADSTRYFVVSATTYDLYQIVLDAMLVFPSVTDPVQITSLVTTSSTLTIHIGSATQFVVSSYTALTSPVYIRDSYHNLLVIGSYAASLPSNTTITLTNVSFEPSTVFEIPASLGVSSINAGTGPITGNVAWGEGYQVALIPGNNQIDVEVGRNYGLPLPCGDFITTDIPLDCSVVASSVNGVTPDKTGNPIYFVGTNHVVVYDDPDDHRIYIGYDFNLTDVSTQRLLNPPSLL